MRAAINLTFPAQHRTKLHSTNPLARLKKEVKHHADVVGIIFNKASITPLIGAVLQDLWRAFLFRLLF
jgi:putative transposase